MPLAVLSWMASTGLRSMLVDALAACLAREPSAFLPCLTALVRDLLRPPVRPFRLCPSSSNSRLALSTESSVVGKSVLMTWTANGHDFEICSNHCKTANEQSILASSINLRSPKMNMISSSRVVHSTRAQTLQRLSPCSSWRLRLLLPAPPAAAPCFDVSSRLKCKTGW